jgi:hypothetical protein
MATEAKSTTTASSANDKLTSADVKAIAQEGNVFGLPLVYIAQEADVLTNIAKPEGRPGTVQSVRSPSRVH